MPSVNPEPVTEQPIFGLEVREIGFVVQLHVVDELEGRMALHAGARRDPDPNHNAQVF